MRRQKSMFTLKRANYCSDCHENYNAEKAKIAISYKHIEIDYIVFDCFVSVSAFLLILIMNVMYCVAKTKHISIFVFVSYLQALSELEKECQKLRRKLQFEVRNWFVNRYITFPTSSTQTYHFHLQNCLNDHLSLVKFYCFFKDLPLRFS